MSMNKTPAFLLFWDESNRIAEGLSLRDYTYGEANDMWKAAAPSTRQSFEQQALQQAAKKALLETLNKNAIEMEAALDTPAANDMIYAWNDTGLGVKLFRGKPQVVGAIHATSNDMISKLTGGKSVSFVNGAGAGAEVMLRQRAIRIALQSTLKTIADVSAR